MLDICWLITVLSFLTLDSVTFRVIIYFLNWSIYLWVEFCGFIIRQIWINTIVIRRKLALYVHHSNHILKQPGPFFHRFEWSQIFFISRWTKRLSRRSSVFSRLKEFLRKIILAIRSSFPHLKHFTFEGKFPFGRKIPISECFWRI